MNHQKSVLEKYWIEHFLFTPSEMAAFHEVDRENFVPKAVRLSAYEDTPLPSLRGTTISQPTTVMIMTHALELEEGDKVFEVGAGSGYQSAIISSIIGPSGKLVSTEVIPELVSFSKENLSHAKISNVDVFECDGSKGYEKEAPYDRIVIGCACKEFPKPLLEQLKPDGIIVGPVGDSKEQELVRGIKGADGKMSYDFLGQVVFSPMVGKFGFED